MSELAENDLFKNLPDEEFVKSIQRGFLVSKTWKQYHKSLPKDQRKYLVYHAMAVLYRKPCQLLFECVIALASPKQMRQIMETWFENGRLENLSLKTLKVFPLQYLSREQQALLCRNRLKSCFRENIPVKIFTSEETGEIRGFLHKVIVLIVEKCRRDLEEYRKAGCPEERLIVTHAGNLTKSLSSITDKLENSVRVEGISIAADEEKQFDWTIFGTLTEKKMRTTVPKQDDDDEADPTFSGNSHSDKTSKHLLISLKCDKYGVPEGWWVLIVDIIKTPDGNGDFKFKPGDKKSGFSNFKLTFEALTRATAQFIVGDYKITKKYEGTTKVNKTGAVCLYPTLIYEPIYNKLTLESVSNTMV